MAAYEILLLNTAIPQIQAAQSGDTYVVPRDIAFSAALTLSAGTANGVPYLNASKVLTTGSALTFDGAQLGVNGITVGRGAGAVSTNTAVGASALAANITGSFSTAIGAGAGAAQTTGQNIYIGNDAGGKVTTGDQNIAIGISSLGWNIAAGNTTGTYNTTVGTQSMTRLSSGSYNTALGYAALAFNTTASNNTAVGYQALYTNTTGALNVAVGSYALYSNTTAIANTAVGYNAGYSNTTGVNLVAIGRDAGYNNTTGNFNNAIGANALLSNTTGANNTALGEQSLFSNTTASYNTAVGYQSLYSSDPALTNATSLTSGNNGTVYTIISVGSTDFTAIGAASNTAGITFTKSGGTGTGTGTVKQNVDAKNTAIGYGSGSAITTGTKNTIIGSYNGNQGGLDIRTLSNYLVLSDGDGNPRIYHNGTTVVIPSLPTSSAGLPSGGLWNDSGTLKVA